MHVYHKFGLFLIFILSVSTCCTRAAPPATNQNSTNDNHYDDYDDDYYDETDSTTTPPANRLTPTEATTTYSSLFNIVIPSRSNHVLEPSCPKACLCLEDYKFIQCSNARLTHVPHDIPSTALIIDLSENHIRELRANDFANCTKVREINLNGNELTEVTKEAFEGLRLLQRLRLSNNRLTVIDPDAFTGASDLSTLDLSNNTITLKSGASFLNQPSMLNFSCRHCGWSQLYDETFANLSSLTVLKLDQNDFNKQINTKAFTPLKNLIKLKLPELDQESIQELCNLLKSIDNISFKHFDISCYELVLGASFNESLILATDPPYKPPVVDLEEHNEKVAAASERKPNSNKASGIRNNNMTEISGTFSNLTLASVSSGDGGTVEETIVATTNAAILAAGVLNGGSGNTTKADDDKDTVYQVPISQEVINILLICIMVIAVVGIIIGLICRKDVGGIKTKCCRTRQPEPKDQLHPAEEIPLNKLA